MLVTTDLKGEETPCPAEEVFADVFFRLFGYV